MPRPAPSWTALLAGIVLACGAEDADLPDPPRPANLAGFDAVAVERIEVALASLAADPRRAQAWGVLGMVYASERQRGLAAECYRTAARLEPEQPKWPYHEAIVLAQTGALHEAITALERSLALEPSYPPSHARLGQFRLDLGDLDGAERAFRRAIELDSTYPGGRLGLARVALQRERHAEAVALLEELCKEDPEDGTFRHLLSVARRESGGTAALPSEAVLADVELKVWNDPWAQEARAFRREPAMIMVAQLLQSGDAAGALALLEEERARGKSIEETALHFASALRLLGRVDEALRELEPVLAREPDNTQALMLQVHLFDERGDEAGALAAVERVARLQPTFGGAFAIKARKLAKLGAHAEAVEAYRRAIELGVDDLELRVGLGNALIVLKRWPEARAHFTALVAERPEDGDTWLQLALATLRTEDFDEAEVALERARAAGNASPRLLENVRVTLHDVRARRAQRAEENP
jgi:tetratricopeptide (TPR) repeat protein